MTGELAKALAAFQGEAPVVAKDKTARVPIKSGGSYSYSYADLADIAAAAYPLLSRHGLAFTCLPETGDGAPRMALRGLLMHTSGESVEGVLPLSGGTPQEIGSSLTYARRYLLGCLTGIVTDADDDGHLAQQAAAKRKPDAPKEQPRPDSPLTAAKRRLADLAQSRVPQGAVIGPWLRGQFAERSLDPDEIGDVERLIGEWSS